MTMGAALLGLTVVAEFIGAVIRLVWWFFT